MKTIYAMSAILLLLLGTVGACIPIHPTTSSTTLTTTLPTSSTSTIATTTMETIATTLSTSVTTTIASHPATTTIPKVQASPQGRLIGSGGGVSCYECERARLIKLGSSYFIVNGSAVVSQRGSVVVRFYNPSLGLVCVNYGEDLVWCGLPLSSCTGKPSHVFAC